MHRWRRWATNDEGSAALEFITVGLIMLVPLVYLVVTLGIIQRQSLGVEAAARHTARAISQAPDAATAVERSDAILASVVDEYGIDADAVEVSLSCAPRGLDCPSAGAIVSITIRTRIALPLVPPVLGLDTSTAIPVEATAVQKISRLWGHG